MSAVDRRTRDWYVDKLVQGIVFLGGSSAIIFIIGIFVFIAKEGLGFLVKHVATKGFLFSPYWEPTIDDPEYGILAMIVGTASVTGLAIVVSIPLSLGAAIYIGEFAKGKTREGLKVAVEFLAAIPSVVWGFIGLRILNPFIIQVFDVPVGINIFNAGVILGLMAAPIMTSIA